MMKIRKLDLIAIICIAGVVAILVPMTKSLWPQYEIRQEIETLKSSTDLQKRYEALDKLMKSGSDAHEALPVLLITINDRDCGVRWRSADALGDVAKGETAVVQALEKCLLDSDYNVRLFSIYALARTRPLNEHSADKLLPFSQDEDPKIRESSIQSLGFYTMFPSKAEAIFEAQQRLSKDENSEVRRITCYSLGVYGKHSLRKEVIDELIRMLGDSVYNVRWQAMDALGEIGASSRSSLPKLEIIAKNVEEEPEIRETAEDVIDAIRTGKKYEPKYTYKHLIR